MNVLAHDSAAAREAIAAVPGWYHTIDVAAGVATPGFCDLRPFGAVAVPADVAGKRALDVGTFDGFWAFELEARGAREVVALDLPEGVRPDWPPNSAAANEAEAQASGVRLGEGFRVAARLRGSAARRVELDVRDLALGAAPELGQPFDVVLCGTLSQHLRDPVGALQNMRSVLAPGGQLLLMETYVHGLSRGRRGRTPLAEFRPAVAGSRFTWWAPNLAALRGWATTAGFTELEELGRHEPLRGAGAGDHLIALRYSG